MGGACWYNGPMNVELSGRAARLAEDLVQNGRFASVEDALEYGLMAIEQLDAEAADVASAEIDELWADLRERVREADEDIAAGRVRRVGTDFVDTLRERVRQLPPRVQLAGRKLAI